jgi:hypothetical protein
MSFVQPFLLIALPLVMLPIVIHLINQHRHRTVNWAAMMFLLDAKRMSKGIARLRHILIMAMRMAAIAGLVFAISRPLAGGWLGGAAGGKPETTIVLLDRSASMEQQNLQTGASKRSTALAKLAELLETRGVDGRIVLIETAEQKAQELNSPKDLVDLPNTTGTSAASDIPALMQSAMEYMAANQTGRTDVWICSDLADNDWDADSGRWETLRKAYAEREGVQLYLLTYADEAPENLSVRVEGVTRRQVGNQAELVMDVQVRRLDSPETSVQVPLQFVVNGVRSVLNLELTQAETSLLGHTIPIDGKLARGWGRVELPADANPIDNKFYFAFSDPPQRHAVIVSDNSTVAEALRLVTAVPQDQGLKHEATVLSSDAVGELAWDEAGLILWQAPLPTGAIAKQLEQFVESGRVVMFFPPDQANDTELFAARWGGWQKAEQGQKISVEWWRSDADLLAHGRSGSPLPLDKLKTYRFCSLENGGNPLAKLTGGKPLLARVGTDQGGVYFCSTLPSATHSSLARDGVVFYVMLQRALAQGADALSDATQKSAQVGALGPGRWTTVRAADEASLSDRHLHAGVYESDNGRLVALNRSEAEDLARPLDQAAVDRMLSGLNYERIDDVVDSDDALATEIWRLFLVAMALALMTEAALCLPSKKPVEETPVGMAMPSGN